MSQYDGTIKACEPRPPKAEWFGKWKHWWVSETDKGDNEGRGHLCSGIWWRFWPSQAVCRPTTKDGCPVGWQVVGE